MAHFYEYRLKETLTKNSSLPVALLSANQVSDVPMVIAVLQR